MKIDVYDPAMCCSTGVCGPSVDASLATFAGDLDWLAQRGAQVRRFNLGQEPGAFAEHDGVRGLLQDQGEAALPAVYVNGELRSSGCFPSRDELSSWAEVSTIGGAAPAAAVDDASDSACCGGSDPVAVVDAAAPKSGCC